ncbi:septal ring factor EnvC (AmiA/AmiB activator) [Methylopila jiangsuensis]|nr:hypothetical protein [Methylopila jiangsuensis]MDR6287329.1 septal ring factor EnvC (AmiA/AmiB activator) [Methylopila jiangsuensis]
MTAGDLDEMVNTRFNALNASLAQLNQKVLLVKAMVDTHETKIAELDGKSADLQTSVDGVSVQIDAVREDLETLTDRVDGIGIPTSSQIQVNVHGVAQSLQAFVDTTVDAVEEVDQTPPLASEIEYTPTDTVADALDSLGSRVTALENAGGSGGGGTGGGGADERNADAIPMFEGAAETVSDAITDLLNRDGEQTVARTALADRVTTLEQAPPPQVSADDVLMPVSNSPVSSEITAIGAPLDALAPQIAQIGSDVSSNTTAITDIYAQIGIIANQMSNVMDRLNTLEAS